MPYKHNIIMVSLGLGTDGWAESQIDNGFQELKESLDRGAQIIHCAPLYDKLVYIIKEYITDTH